MIKSVEHSVQTTFNAWKVYHGMYLHFTNDSYDFFKYNGNGTWGSIASMEKYFFKFEKYGKSSFQRGFFETIGKTYTDRDDLIFWFLSQFTNELDHPDDFDSDLYEDYKKRMNDFNFYLRLDIEKIICHVKEYDITFHELFISKGINHPPILKLALGKTISLETFTVLDILLNFIPVLNEQLQDSIWFNYQKLALNYKPFLSIDAKKCGQVVKDVVLAAHEE
jgi:hypothetical protein